MVEVRSGKGLAESVPIDGGVAAGAIGSEGALVLIFMAGPAIAELKVGVLNVLSTTGSTHGGMAFFARYLLVFADQLKPCFVVVEDWCFFPDFGIMTGIALRFRKLLLMRTLIVVATDT